MKTKKTIVSLWFSSSPVICAALCIGLGAVVSLPIIARAASEGQTTASMDATYPDTSETPPN